MAPSRILLVSALLAGLSVAPLAAREITHAMGVTDVPDNARRIVVLTNEGTEALLSIGVVPIGSVESWNGDPWYNYLMPMMAEATLLGAEGAVNLELIAALEPDLILGSKVRQEAVYKQLSAIAPTVMTETLGAVWRDNLAVYADALGRNAEADVALADFDRRITAIHDALGDTVEEEISLVRFSPARTRMYFKESFCGAIIDAIGFARPAAQDKDGFAEDLTKERIPELAADRIFYFSPGLDDAEGEANLANWLADSLWRNLSAVQVDRTYRVGDAVWIAGGGIFAANALLDDIEAIYGLASTR